MALETQVKIECDVCHWPAKAFKNEASAEDLGFRKIVTECYFVDRDFKDRWICGCCVSKIFKADEKYKEAHDG